MLFPRLIVGITTDPLGFEDDLNLYCYIHNNSFCYKDSDGRFALALPFPIVFTVFQVAFGATATVTFLPFVGASLGVAAIGYGCYQLAVYASNQIDTDHEKSEIEAETEKNRRKKGKDNEIKGGPPRDRYTGDYLPDPLAEGTPHTTLGNREGRRVGTYTQGVTFDEKGKFKGRTDVTDHGRYDHVNPHYHPATGSNSVDSQSITVPEFLW